MVATNDDLLKVLQDIRSLLIRLHNDPERISDIATTEEKIKFDALNVKIEKEDA